MSIDKIFILTRSLAFSIIKVYANEKADSFYKILKIQTTGDYYVIHAQRNDSLFKIISKKVSLDPAQLEHEVEFLNKILLQTETILQLCSVSEVIDINRYKVIHKPSLIEKLITSNKGLKPFQFLNNKN